MKLNEIKLFAWADEVGGGGGSSSTLVIANYDSHESSKATADILIEEGEDAAKKINEAIQSLKDTGGEIKLLEGVYVLKSAIEIKIPNIHLTGIPGATILTDLDEAWKPVNTGDDLFSFITTQGLAKTEVVTISNLYLDSKSRRQRYGITTSGDTVLQNLTIKNFGWNLMKCYDNTLIDSCNISSGNAVGLNNYTTVINTTFNECNPSVNNLARITACKFEDCNYLYIKHSSIVTDSEFKRITNLRIEDIAIINNSRIEGTAFCGIYDDATISKCIVNKNTRNGITANDKTKILNCYISNNNFYGITLNDSFAGTCAYNYLDSNKSGSISVNTTKDYIDKYNL